MQRASTPLKWLDLERKDKSPSWINNNERWAKWVDEGINKAPGIGKKPIGSVTQDDVYRILRAVEELGYAPSAEYVRAQVSRVFEYAARKRMFTGRNPAQDLKGEIKRPSVRNNPHIKAREIPDFLKAVEESKGSKQTKIASKLLLLTILRKQELLAARWSELDLDGATWEIPAERMKNGLPHIVPLSAQVVSLFRAMKEETGGKDFVFPNTQRPGTFMGLSTLNVFFDRIGYSGDRLTPHGLRSVASTALNEAGFRPDVIERQLSHVEKNQVRRAYNKADYMEERRRMMQHWADYVDQLCNGERESNVIQLTAKAAA